MKTGNTRWWEQVHEYQQDTSDSLDYKVAELEVFKILYMRMKNGGMTQGEIMEHFSVNFGIGYTAFYTRVRKIGGLS